MNNEFLQTEEAIVAMLKTVYDGSELPGRRFYSGRCPHESGIGRWGEQRGSQPRIRTGMG